MTSQSCCRTMAPNDIIYCTIVDSSIPMIPSVVGKIILIYYEGMSLRLQSPLYVSVTVQTHAFVQYL
jgi:hypothetical protein